MFLYQAAIMVAVIALVFCAITLLHIRKSSALKRSILAVIILALITGGALSLSVIQDYFNGQYYQQKLDPGLYSSLKVGEKQKESLPSLFPDYKNITADEASCSAALQKTYKIRDGAVSATLTVDLFCYKTRSGADEFFRLHQDFYDNKLLLLYDPKLSRKTAGADPKYITSYIHSSYSSPKDLLYLPSKMSYLSEIVVQNDNFVLFISENSNRPVTEKAKVLKTIRERLGIR